MAFATLSLRWERIMSRIACSALCRSLLLASVLTLSQSAHAQGDADVEAKFIAMLNQATLNGSWAPVQQGKLGGERGDDRYRIARVEKSAEGRWSIVSVINTRDRQIEFAIPVTVKFAGDATVLLLDNVRSGQGSANWSARVMFHDDVYAGRWWETANREHGGTIAGTITRQSATLQPQTPTKKPTTAPTGETAPSIDGRVVQIAFPIADITLDYIEARGGMSIQMVADKTSVIGNRFFVGDGTIAVELFADATAGILFQGKTKLKHGHTFKKYSVVDVQSGYKSAADLKPGDVYVIFPTLTFKLPNP